MASSWPAHLYDSQPVREAAPGHVPTFVARPVAETARPIGRDEFDAILARWLVAFPLLMCAMAQAMGM